MFPSHGSEIYRNEAGEPTGWSAPASADTYWCDKCGFSHAGDCPVPPDEDDEIEDAKPEPEDTGAGPHYTDGGDEIVVGGRYWDNGLHAVTVTELAIHADTNNNPDNGPIGRKTWWHDTTGGMADGSRLALRHPFTGELAPPA